MLVCEYIFHVNQSDLEYVHELKRLTPPKDWSSLRDEILQTDSLKWTTKYDFLCEEELYDKLFNALMTSCSPEYVWRYEKALRAHYPFELQEILAILLDNEMASAGSRNHYQAVIAKLSIISAYPDGKETVARIVNTWVHTYSRRRAMLEELQDAGYDISK